MKNLILTLSGLSVAVLLAACGGGGGVDDSAAAASATATVTATATPGGVDATRYAGAWGSCSSIGNGASEQESIVITATSASSFDFIDTTTSYAAPGCAGAAGAITKSTSGTVVFTGTKTVATDTVDAGILTQGTDSRKQIFLATATTITTGRMAQDGGVLDADGYPTTLDPNGLVRQ
jgi:hypothetical protein